MYLCGMRYNQQLGFPGSSVVKNLSASAGATGSKLLVSNSCRWLQEPCLKSVSLLKQCLVSGSPNPWPGVLICGPKDPGSTVAGEREVGKGEQEFVYIYSLSPPPVRSVVALDSHRSQNSTALESSRNHPSLFSPVLGKISSRKLVPCAKKVGDHCLV